MISSLNNQKTILVCLFLTIHFSLSAQHLGKIELQNLSIITDTPIMPVNENDDILIEGSYYLDKEFDKIIIGNKRQGQTFIYDAKQQIIKAGMSFYLYRNGRLNISYKAQREMPDGESVEKFIVTLMNDNSKVHTKTKYIYNNQNQIEQKEIYEDSGLIGTCKYEYDALGRIIHVDHVMRDVYRRTVPVEDIMYEYNANNDIVLKYDKPTFIELDGKKGTFSDGYKYIYTNELPKEMSLVTKSSIKVTITTKGESMTVSYSSAKHKELVVGSALAADLSRGQIKMTIATNPNPTWEVGKTTYYEYDFNPQGNWIMRKSFQKNKDGNIQLIEANYREFRNRAYILQEKERKKQEKLIQEQKEREAAESQMIEAMKQQQVINLAARINANNQAIQRLYTNEDVVVYGFNVGGGVKKPQLYSAYQSVMLFYENYINNIITDKSYIITNMENIEQRMNTILRMQENMAGIFFTSKTKAIEKELKNKTEILSKLEFLSNEALGLVK